jgi:hypothetical protein
MAQLKGFRTLKGAIAAPPYTNGPYTFSEFVAFTGGLGAVNTDGVVIYVSQLYGNDANDGKSWKSAKATIQAGVDACPGNAVGQSSNLSQGDVVLVGPGKYQENVYIAGRTSSGGVVTVAGHDGIKIIAIVPGWETRVRVNDATTKYALVGGGVHQNQDATGFVVMARSVEISGFCIDGDSAAYCGIYAGDGVRSGFRTGSGGNASSLYVHDCLFQQGGYGIILDGAGSFHRIQNNTFQQLSYAGVYNCPSAGRQTEKPQILGNIFVLGNAALGVDMYSSSAAASKSMLIEGNTFIDGPSATGTYGIRTYGAGIHTIAGNHFGCANTMTIQTGDFTSGNFESNTGGTPTYVTEA